MWLFYSVTSGLAFLMLMITYGATGQWREDVMRSRTPSIFMILAGVCTAIFQRDVGAAAAMMRIGLIGGRNRALHDAIDRIDHGRSTPHDIDILIAVWMLTKDYDYMRLIEFVRSSPRGAVANAAMAFHIATVQYPEWMHE